MTSPLRLLNDLSKHQCVGQQLSHLRSSSPARLRTPNRLLPTVTPNFQSLSFRLNVCWNSWQVVGSGPRPTGQDGRHKQLHWDVDQKHCLQRGSGRLPRRLCSDDCRNHNTKLDLLRKRDESWHIYTLYVRPTSAVLEYKLPFLSLRLHEFSALRGVSPIFRLSGQR